MNDLKTPPTEAQVREWLRLCKEAGTYWDHRGPMVFGSIDDYPIAECVNDDGEGSKNATLIAAARNALPALAESWLRMREQTFTPSELRRIAEQADCKPRNGQDIRIAEKARRALADTGEETSDGLDFESVEERESAEAAFGKAKE